MDYFRQYLIVGGMPQAVDFYARTEDFRSVCQGGSAEKMKKSVGRKK